MTLTSRLCTTALALCLAVPASAETLLVTNFDATGAGSLQAALDAAGASPERTVVMIEAADGTITTEVGLTYEGASPLVIIGNGAKRAANACLVEEYRQTANKQAGNDGRCHVDLLQADKTAKHLKIK